MENSHQTSLLLSIAPEVRLQIYREVFRGFTVQEKYPDEPKGWRFQDATQEEVIFYWSTRVYSDIDYSLLLTCRTIYQEAKPVLDNSSTHFEFTLTHDLGRLKSRITVPDFSQVTLLSLHANRSIQTTASLSDAFPRLQELRVKEELVHIPRSWFLGHVPLPASAQAAATWRVERDEGFKTLVKTNQLARPPSHWLRNALDDKSRNFSILQTFICNPPSGYWCPDPSHCHGGQINLRFDMDTMETVEKVILERW